MKLFLAVARSGSFAAAARDADVSAPTVTRAVQQLEEELGVQLFLRSAKGATLTDKGTRYSVHARSLLDSISNIKESLQDTQLAGELRIGLPAMLATTRLTSELARFGAQNERLRLRVITSTDNLDLMDDQVAVIVHVGENPSPKAVGRKLGPLPTLLVASPTLLEEYGEPTSREELERIPGIGLHSMRSGSVTNFEVNGFDEVELNAIAHFDDMSSLLRATLDGVGIARIIAPVAQPLVERGELVSLFDGAITPSASVWVLRNSQSPVPQKVQQAFDLIVEVLEEMTTDEDPLADYR